LKLRFYGFALQFNVKGQEKRFKTVYSRLELVISKRVPIRTQESYEIICQQRVTSFKSDFLLKYFFDENLCGRRGIFVRTFFKLSKMDSDILQIARVVPAQYHKIWKRLKDAVGIPRSKVFKEALSDAKIVMVSISLSK